jgi:hypothetical protein
MNDPVTLFVRPGCSNSRLVKEYLLLKTRGVPIGEPT